MLPLFPDQASTIAPRVDHLYFFLLTLTAFFSTLIFSCVFYFAIKYRRSPRNPKPTQIAGSLPLEVFWTLVPLVITMIIFFWGATLYFFNGRPPDQAVEMYVVGKQWMWKLQHPEGRREIDELHVPVNVPVKLIMTSEDVIHSFFIPAFRVKHDVLPGRYTTIWFQATKPGRYHLFCAEYCGNQHSGMIGSVISMEPAEYEQWLGGGASEESMAASGEALFERFGCSSCHRAKGTGRGPSLVGVFGNPVVLDNGQTVTADESYVRESILNPRARVVVGYRPIMPTFQGQVSEEQLVQLIAYLKSLK